MELKSPVVSLASVVRGAQMRRFVQHAERSRGDFLKGTRERMTTEKECQGCSSGTTYRRAPPKGMQCSIARGGAPVSEATSALSSVAAEH